MDNNDIGNKVNALRKEKKITLKQLSEQTGLSTGFLSQFERGMTSIAIDSLQNIAKILEVDMDSFFDKTKIKKESESPIIRSHDREIEVIGRKYIQYNMLNDVEDAEFLPRIYEVLPKAESGHSKTYVHEGVEFIYVLEGILTLSIKNQVYELYPEDGVYLRSDIPHNWENNTSKKVRILSINSPNPYKKKK